MVGQPIQSNKRKGRVGHRNFATTTGMSIGAAPGIVAFINNYTAVEVSIGVLGLNFSKTKQTTNQVYQGEHSSSSANFKINLFSIGLGLAFYL